jgi:Sucrose synthase
VGEWVGGWVGGRAGGWMDREKKRVLRCCRATSIGDGVHFLSRYLSNRFVSRESPNTLLELLFEFLGLLQHEGRTELDRCILNGKVSLELPL